MDFDSDGKLDLVAGDADGTITFFKNVGTSKEPKLAAGVLVEAGSKVIKPDERAAGSLTGHYSKIHLADWDGDGLVDILVGQDPNDYAKGPQLVMYKNIGTKEKPQFAVPVALNIIQGNRLPRPSPYVVDWDGDGKRDVLLGTDSNQVYFLKNTGTKEKPEFAAPEAIALPGLEKCYRVRLAVTDWNNDGKLDLVVGTFYSEKNNRGGNVWLFLRK